MRSRILTVAALAAILLLPQLAFAGQGWEIEYQYGEDNTAILSMDDQHIRVVPKGEDEEVIVGPESITILNHGDKSMMVMTFAEIEAMMGGMMDMAKQMEQSMKKSMDEAMKDMDEEERAEMKAQMEKMGMDTGDGESSDAGPKIEYKKVGSSEKIAGIQTDKYEIHEDGDKKGEVWVTGEVSMAAIENVVTRLAKSLPPSMMGDMDFGAMMNGIPGFPLKMVSEEDEDENVVAVRADKKNFGAKDWEGPAGYEKKNMSNMMQGMGGGR